MEGYGNENPGAFQPTRPLRGATVCHKFHIFPAIGFQPTRPLRGATVRRLFGAVIRFIISTHAPLAGRDEFLNSNAR